MRMSRVTHMNTSWHMYECVVSHHTYEKLQKAPLIHTCCICERVMYTTCMNESCGCRRLSLIVQSCIHICRIHTWSIYVFIYAVYCLNHQYTYMHESCLLMQQPQDSFIYAVYMSHVAVAKDNTCMNESCHTYEWVMSHI